MLSVRLLSALLQLAATSAHAADPRTYIPGRITSGDVETMVNIGIVAKGGDFLVTMGGAFAVLFVVVGGFQMLLAFGDDGKFESGRKNVTVALIGLALVMVSQIALSFVDAKVKPVVGSARPLFDVQSAVVNALFSIFNAVFLVIIMAAGVRMAIGRGKTEEFAAGKKALGFAIAGGLIMNLARALAYAVYMTLR